MPPLYSFPRPDGRRLESLFIFISFGLVCRLAARHRDYRVPATHLGNSGGPLSAARSSPTTSFPLKRAEDPRGMTTDGVRPGASGTNLPSPPAAPRPSSFCLSPSPFFSSSPCPSSRAVLRHRSSSLLYPLSPSCAFLLFHLFSSPSCSCSISSSSLLSFSFSLLFLSFLFPFCLILSILLVLYYHPSLPPSCILPILSLLLLLPLSEGAVFLLHSLPVFLSLSPLLPCSPPLAH